MRRDQDMSIKKLDNVYKLMHDYIRGLNMCTGEMKQDIAR